MTTGQRISITLYSTLALAFLAIGLANHGGFAASNAWLVGFIAASALAVVGVFFVNRWWALLPALTTVTAFWSGVTTEGPASLGAFLTSGYAGPLFFLPILIGIAVLSIGLLARAIWDHLIGPIEPEDARTEEVAR